MWVESHDGYLINTDHFDFFGTDILPIKIGDHHLICGVKNFTQNFFKAENIEYDIILYSRHSYEKDIGNNEFLSSTYDSCEEDITHQFERFKQALRKNESFFSFKT